MRLTHTLKSDFTYITQAIPDLGMLANKQILISGANGFIASYLIHFLLFLNDQHNAQIKIVAVLRDKNKLDKTIATALSVRLIEQDICQPIATDIAVDIILHTASYACPSLFQQDPVGTALPNTIGTNVLLEYAHRNKVEQFIFFSTTGVYGHNPADRYPLSETDFGALDCADLSACYLESKRMGENLCVSYHKQYGVPIKIVRPAITFGPGINLFGRRSYEDFIGKIVRGENLELVSDGSAIRNFCYISDFITGLLNVVLHGRCGEAYNLATDEEISIAELATKLTTDIFKEKQLQVIYSSTSSEKILRTEFNKTTVDITKAKRLGWSIQVPTLEGFKRTVEYYTELRESL